MAESMNLLTSAMSRASEDSRGVWHVVLDNETRTLDEFTPMGQASPGVSLEVEELGDVKRRASEARTQLALNETPARAMEYFVQELGRNVVQHAWPSRPAALEIAWDHRSRALVVAIADDGIGLAGSLRTFHPARTDGEALKLALAPGVTGRVPAVGGDEENAGAGLFIMRTLAANFRGSFVLLSGETIYMQSADVDIAPPDYVAIPSSSGSAVATLEPAYPGTAVLAFCRPRTSDSFAPFLEMVRDAYHDEVAAAVKQYGLRDSLVLSS